MIDPNQTTVQALFLLAGAAAGEADYCSPLMSVKRSDVQRAADTISHALDRIVEEVDEARDEVADFSARWASMPEQVLSTHPLLVEIADVAIIALSLTYHLGALTPAALMQKVTENACRAFAESQNIRLSR